MWCFFIDAYVCLLYLFVSILSAVFYIALSLRSTQYTCKYNLAHFSWKGSCGTSSYWNCPNWITDSQPEYQFKMNGNTDVSNLLVFFMILTETPTENRRLRLQQSWTLNRKLGKSWETRRKFANLLGRFPNFLGDLLRTLDWV